MLTQRDQLTRMGQVALRGDRLGLRLADIAAVFETIGLAFGDQSFRGNTDLCCILANITGIKQPSEIGIGGGNRGGQKQPRLGLFDGGGARFGSGGGQRSVVLAPQVEIEFQIDPDSGIVLKALRQQRDELFREAIVEALLFGTG